MFTTFADIIDRYFSEEIYCFDYKRKRNRFVVGIIFAKRLLSLGSPPSLLQVL